MGFGLVLGGGGAIGVAWEIAVLAALEDAGASLLGADVVVGTSAGSIVGAQVFGGRSFDDMLAEMEVTESPAEVRDAPGVGDGGDNPVRSLFEELSGITDRAERARRLGQVGLEATTFPEEMYLQMMQGIIQVTEWPTTTRFLPTAGDCETGERVAWEAAPDVPLVAAVASSCCVPGVVPPVTIRGRRYVDGGVWSPSNADLLLGTGVDRAIFIGPFGGPESPSMGAAASDLAEELAALEAAGIPTITVLGGAELRAAVGLDALNPALRPVSSRIGRTDGAAAADLVRSHLGG